MTRLNRLINEIVRYAEKKELISGHDRAYSVARLLELFDICDFSPENVSEKRELCEILSDLSDEAAERGLIESNTVVFRDLFDTKVMGIFTPRPSEVIEKFERLYEQDYKAATDYFYRLACDSNYIRCDRIRRDLKWRVESKYGEIDITVNLSKPEKDPKAIAAAKLLPQTDFPKCVLCHENEGFAGNPSKPARQNLRQIPFEMCKEIWYLQYSPYVYYNEHCIALSAEHHPMKIDRSSFEKLIGFVSHFPHYFIGSNADLPIVGGSILSHDHMQGGRYTFAMELAKEKKELHFDGFADVRASILKWPLSVIRLQSKNKDSLVSLADKIRVAWERYTDEDALVFSHTGEVRHNTITPIARRKGEYYELDLTLRNNLTTEEHPLGVYHPHSEHHNIKKENIGLIEVMGLAVLPARLKEEMALMKRAILAQDDFSIIPEIQKHAAWFECFRNEYSFTEENTEEIIKQEIGKTFVRVLLDAGVYKDSDEGLRAFEKFIKTVNEG